MIIVFFLGVCWLGAVVSAVLVWFISEWYRLYLLVYEVAIRLILVKSTTSVVSCHQVHHYEFCHVTVNNSRYRSPEFCFFSSIDTKIYRFCFVAVFFPFLAFSRVHHYLLSPTRPRPSKSCYQYCGTLVRWVDVTISN